jgi:two-component system, sensor histidine kinase
MYNLPINDSYPDGDTKMELVIKRKELNPSKNDTASSPKILTGMSYEMRAHMNEIVAFSFMMKENSCTDPDREKFSNQIFKSCEQLIGLFDNFFDSAILNTDDTKEEARAWNFNNLLDDLLSEFRDTINEVPHKDLELRTDIEFKDSLNIFIDRNKLYRILHSLFQNSLRNTKSGYIKIGYNFSSNLATFFVLDSGLSYFKNKEFINSNNISESLTLHNDTYTAVNINLAKKLISLLGGTVWIEKYDQSGSGIYFTLPAMQVSSFNNKKIKKLNTMINI